jgi:hypothetical protein
MTPYPDSFPTDSFTLVLSKLRGGDLPTKELVHACWVVAGYALGQVMGGGPEVKGEAMHSGLADDQVIAAALDNSTASVQIVQGVFPWRLVLAIALRLIKEACSCC